MFNTANENPGLHDDREMQQAVSLRGDMVQPDDRRILAAAIVMGPLWGNSNDAFSGDQSATNAE